MKYFKIFSSFVKWYFILAGVSATICMIIVFSCLLNLYKVVASMSDSKSQDQIVSINDSSDYKVVSIDIDEYIYDEDTVSTRALIKGSLHNTRYLSFKYVDKLIDRICEDKNIQGVLINVKDVSSLSSIGIEKLQKSFLKLRVVNKFLYAYITELDTKSLLLSSIADKRILTPTGEANLIGYNFNFMYLGNALKKLGVDINVVRMGEYKNAFEFLVSNSLSKETIEEYSSLGEEISSYYIENISNNLGISNLKVAEWFKRSIFTAREAELERIVEVGYPEDFLASIIEGFDANKHVVDDSLYTGKNSSPLTIRFSNREENISNAVGIINLRGDIVLDESEDSISVQSFDRMFRWAQNPEIKGVVVKINSPGGVLSPSDIIWKKLKYLSSIKPVVVSMQDVTASGGYYIASASNYIYTHPTTITGSIGVIGMIPRFQEMEQKYGISFLNLSNSEHKNLLSQGEKLSDKEFRLMQDHIKAHYNTFLERVVAGRGKDINYWDTISRGRVYLGKKALSLGLADAIGGEAEAIEKVKELVGNKDLVVVKYRESSSIPAMFRILIPSVKAFVGYDEELDILNKWVRYLKKEKVYSMLPSWNLKDTNI